MILETSGCICRHDTLEELAAVTGKSLLSMAVFVGKTRLIDNFVIG
jgi:pantothenate synthetase